jgi:O-antigen/teichoic acid export membrane protein
MRVAPLTVQWFYDPSFGIGYIFLANLISSIVTLVMLVPELTGFKWTFNGRLWREMLAYSAPLLILGIAGIMNQTLDKIMYPSLAPDKATAMQDLGIYGANYKIAIVMVMFIQAFRFAYEPFIFAQSKEKGENKTRAYSDAMKYFVIFALIIFMGVMFYIDILKYFISPRYFSGLKVVPIIMIAEFFFGVCFNLSVWYKLTDKTIWGMWLSLLGLCVTLVGNALLVPRFGYMGCAWTAFACYGSMMIVSWIVGRVHYPIDYDIRRLVGYTLVTAVLYVLGMYVLVTPWTGVNFAIRAALLACYVAWVVRHEHIALPFKRHKK